MFKEKKLKKSFEDEIISTLKGYDFDNSFDINYGLIFINVGNKNNKLIANMNGFLFDPFLSINKKNSLDLYREYINNNLVNKKRNVLNLLIKKIKEQREIEYEYVMVISKIENNYRQEGVFKIEDLTTKKCEIIKQHIALTYNKVMNRIAENNKYKIKKLQNELFLTCKELKNSKEKKHIILCDFIKKIEYKHIKLLMSDINSINKKTYYYKSDIKEDLFKTITIDIMEAIEKNITIILNRKFQDKMEQQFILKYYYKILIYVGILKECLVKDNTIINIEELIINNKNMKLNFKFDTIKDIELFHEMAKEFSVSALYLFPNNIEE